MATSNRKFLKPAIIFAAWTLFGLFFASQHYVGRAYFGRTPSWSEALGVWMTCAYSWAVLTPAALWLIERFPIKKENWKQALLVHLPAAVLFSLSGITIYIMARKFLFSNEPAPTFKNMIVLDYHQGILIYIVLAGICYGLDYYRKYRERELAAAQLQTQLAQAQLAALKAQLHPHFLFNTLNTIAVLIDEDTNSARKMLVRLSDLLRVVLKKETTDEVSLRQEIDFLEGYLEIEQMRFQDRLKVKLEIAPNTLNARVPDLILQPLVENAIKHGIAPRAAQGQIEIRAERQNGNLLLEVQDNGAGMQEDFSTDGNGVGLANTVARLESLYGANYSFEIRNLETGGLVAALSIPFKEA